MKIGVLTWDSQVVFIHVRDDSEVLNQNNATSEGALPDVRCQKIVDRAYAY